MSVPMLMPTIARGNREASRRKPGARANANPTPPRIEPMLNIIDALAGTPKRCLELSMPIASAAMATSSRKGNMIRVSSTVSSVLPAMS